MADLAKQKVEEGFGTIKIKVGESLEDDQERCGAVRAAIGVVGGAFVPCQAWTSLLFAPRIVGTANAFSAGWGNLGGGVTQVRFWLKFYR